MVPTSHRLTHFSCLSSLLVQASNCPKWSRGTPTIFFRSTFGTLCGDISSSLCSVFPIVMCMEWMCICTSYLEHGGIAFACVSLMCNAACIGFLLPAVFLVAAGYLGCDTVLAVVMITLAVGFAGIALSGYQVNHLDIAPSFAGGLINL